ncbi:protein of unknown function [Nitrospira japonica]|uniref:Uncharacterized protein n=1 Tax=Nitrospira japonica TaxID=1325564 RepID=A0A1W1I686_9BACT|nr:protein of unknown function [Nitrospira japonica]
MCGDVPSSFHAVIAMSVPNLCLTEPKQLCHRSDTEVCNLTRKFPFGRK